MLFTSHAIWIYLGYDMSILIFGMFEVFKLLIVIFGMFGVFKLYSFWVVFCYYKELMRYGPLINDGIRGLRDENLESWVRSKSIFLLITKYILCLLKCMNGRYMTPFLNCAFN